MANPILRITDGTDIVNLLANRNGFGLLDWTPKIAELKGGGSYSGNVMADNQALIHAVFDNVAETFDLRLHADSQDGAIVISQNLRRLLQKAREYWTTSWQRQPVWLEARGSNETNTRYALIHNWGTPNDDNPFAQPFFNCPGAIIDEFTLVVERGHWLSEAPGSSACTLISGSQDYNEASATTGAMQNTTEEPGQNNDTTTWRSLGGGTCMMYIPACSVGQTGAPSASTYHFDVRFAGLRIPKNAIISTAVVKFIADSGVAANKTIEIYGLWEKNPQPMTNCIDWVLRAKYGTYGAPVVSWVLGAVVHGTEYTTPELKTLIQALVDKSDYEYNDNIILLFENGDATLSTKTFIPYGDAVHHAPQLYIEYNVVADSTYGQTATCTADAVFVANKHNRANISHLYRWDASIATYSGNLIQGAEGLPYQLLPTTPEVGDYLYAGISTDLNDSGPFCNVIFDIGTASTGVEGIWEYYNGAWVTLSVVDETIPLDTGESFQNTGIRGVFFAQPSDWITGAVNGVTGYWIRFKITAVVSPTHAHQQNRNPYSVVWPFVEVAANEIAGDLPALIKTIIKNHSYSDTSTALYLGASRVIMGLRSMDRGEYFTPYINLSTDLYSGQNQYGIFNEIVSADVTSVTTTLSPSGKAFRYNPAGLSAEALAFTVMFTYIQLTTYAGTYRCFLRARHISGGLTGVRVRIATVFGDGNAENYSPIVTIPQSGNGYILSDMGILKAIPRAIAGSEIAESFKINVYLENTDAAAVSIDFTDLILMPIDEWAGDFRFTNGKTLSTQEYNDPRLWVDSLGDLSQELRAVGVNENDNVLTTLSKIHSGPMFMQSNKRQRMWFLFDETNPAYPNISNPNVCHSVTVRKNQRYFSMRGNR